MKDLEGQCSSRQPFLTSRYSHLLVSSDVSSKLGLKISKGGGTIKAVNSSPTLIDGVAHKVDVSIGEWHGQENLTVVTMDDFNVVLGLEFLDKMKAVLVPYQHYVHP